MTNLQIKEVDFNGAVLMAAQNPDNKKIYVGISWVCNGIGLSKSQKDTQVLNVQNDIVLNRGCLKLQAGVFDLNNETIAIELEYLPLWLAKISITPKMQNEQPEVTKNLVEYQLKAKDVLAEAFLKRPNCIEDILIASLEEMKFMKLAVKNLDSKIDSIKDVVALNPHSWRKETSAIINKVAHILGGYDHIKPIRSEIYNLLEQRYGVQLSTRLTNKRRRQADEGICKSKRDKLNHLDVIADDKKLIEGYVSIVKEVAIKYGIAS